HKDVDAVWEPIQKKFIEELPAIDEAALKLYKSDPGKAIQFLTEYTDQQGSMVMKRCIKLGDDLWTKYDEKF
ncbi:MAG: peptidase C69, partial [Chlorobi bacterium]|nr:peptidase C69 [Chlorobiota bacterium]